MSALDDWFPGASTPDRRRGLVQSRSGRARPLKRPPRRFRAFLFLIVGAALVAPILAVLAAPVVSGAAIGARQAVSWWESLPGSLPLDAPLPQRSIIYASDGQTVIATHYAENRVPVRLSQIPPTLVDAVIAIEDDRFYEHGPIDVRGTARALVNNASGGSRQGGSGITQQYVKNLLLTEARTDAQRREVTATSIERKLREARLAVAAERTLGKDGVLTNYLNTVYFGRGAYGVAAAAERYFGVRLSKLTLPQAATLAGVLKSPTRYDPVGEPERSKQRRNVVLARMADTGRITEQQAREAQAVPLVTRLTQPNTGCSRSQWPFYCQMVIDTITTNPVFGATPEARQDLLARGGLRIVTAMNPAAMDIAQEAVDSVLEPTNRVATAMAVVEPGTGHVLAIATNRRWGSSGRGQTEIVLPAAAKFQPGSTFKPITLATAFESGISPFTVLDTPDGYIPASLNHPPGGFHNDDDAGHGRITAFEATAESVNTYYVQLIERTGVLPVADMAGRLGMSSLPRTGGRAVTSKDAALTLGAFETSPVQMANVYASLAARGRACPVVVITRMTRVDGSVVPSPPTSCRQAISPAVADMVTSVLRGTFEKTGTAVGLALPDRPAAGKTGTTNNSGATWFAGYTPQLAAAVWVGDPRGPKYALRDVVAYGERFDVVYGRSIAGPAWQKAMSSLTATLPVADFPAADAGALIAVAPTVPNVRGLSRDAAISVLAEAGYRVVIAQVTAAPDPAIASNSVTAQVPVAGTVHSPGARVVITLSDSSDTAVRPPPAGSG